MNLSVPFELSARPNLPDGWTLLPAEHDIVNGTFFIRLYHAGLDAVVRATMPESSLYCRDPYEVMHLLMKQLIEQARSLSELRRMREVPYPEYEAT